MLVIRMVVLNGENDQARVEQLMITILFSRAGGLYSRLKLQSLPLIDGGLYVYILWIFCLVVLSCGCVYRLFRAIRGKALTRHILQWVTALSWFIAFVGWMHVSCFVYQYLLRSEVEKWLEALISDRQSGAKNDITKSVALYDAIEDMAFDGIFQWLTAFYNLVLMFSFLTALHYQPRLAIVTSTLVATMADLIHFVIVFLPTFFAYAMSGNFIFGHNIKEFATLQSSLGTCFKIAMTSEFNWEDLSSEDWLTACLWIWTYIIVVVWLLLNMILAIIMDVYTEINSKAGTETVWQTMWTLWERVRHCRTWVNFNELLDTLDQMEDYVTREMILEQFPEMPDQQLARLLSACDSEARQSSKSSMSVLDTVQMIAAIKLGLDKVAKNVVDLAEHDEVEKEEADMPTSAIEDIHHSMRLQQTWMASINEQLVEMGATAKREDLSDEGR